MVENDDTKGQQQLGTASEAATAAAEPTSKATPKKTGGGKKVAMKPAAQQDSKLLISFSEYRATTDRVEVTSVLEQGFRVWMKTVKQEPLRSRTFSEWDKLIDEYLKS